VNLSVEGQQLPLWCATSNGRRFASIVIVGLWVTSFALFASAVVCPFPTALRWAEVALGTHLAVRLTPMTRLLLLSK
jgi:hypothetical protein